MLKFYSSGGPAFYIKHAPSTASPIWHNSLCHTHNSTVLRYGNVGFKANQEKRYKETWVIVRKHSNNYGLKQLYIAVKSFIFMH